MYNENVLSPIYYSLYYKHLLLCNFIAFHLAFTHHTTNQWFRTWICTLYRAEMGFSLND
jgi:hypothetical protein